MPFLRLRQICLVARHLEPTARKLEQVFGAPVCYRDPNVAKYGLQNVLFAFGGTFLEVISPTSDTATAARYLDRRKGDGGYMYILDCDDLERRREDAQRLNARIVADVKSEKGAAWAAGLHLHPKDTGGCLLSLDAHSSGDDMSSEYLWAGDGWRASDTSTRIASLAGATMQCDDPEAVALRWGDLTRRPVLDRGEGVFEVAQDNAAARFVPVADTRGEGMSEVRLNAKDWDACLAAAGSAARDGAIHICGVRFTPA